MTAVVLVEKTCRACGEIKPVSAFHKDRSKRGGYSTYCAACATAKVMASQAKRRAEIGEQAWAEYNRMQAKASRVRNHMRADRRYNRARSRAVTALIAAHRTEFDALVAREPYEADREVVS